MSSIVTKSTISTLTAASLASPLALVGILVLLVLLVGKELASAQRVARFQALSNILDIGILPLLIAFILVVCSRIADVLH